MKVKIRGLVFVGFAAAVFAQSAMADANDAKTVTSKLYVDSKVEGVTETGSGANLTYGDTTITQNSPNDKAPSALNVYKFVTTTVSNAAVTIEGDETYLTASEDDGTWTVEAKKGVATTAAELTGPIANGVAGAFTDNNGNKLVSATAVKALIDGESTNGTTTLSDATTGGSTNETVPTSKNVVDYAEKKANKATAIVTSGTGQNNTSDTAYPTTKAVYDFVTTQGGNYQPKVTTASATTMYVGKYVPDDPTTTGTNEEQVTWDKLTTGTYVSNTSSTAGTYTLDIPAAQIAASGDFVASNGSNDAARAKLATSGTVYDFVNTNYQAKAAANTNTVQIGYNAGWGTLAGDGTYITVDPNSGSATVSLGNLTAHGVSDTGATPAYTTDFVAASDANATTNRPKLARAGDVYDFVMDQMGGLAIPEMPQDCTDAAEAGGYCALVYGLISSGTSGQAGVTYGLQWTVMAPVPETGGE